MKTPMLKFKAAVLAVSLLAVAPIGAMNHEQFVASMVKEIGQTMFSLLDLVKNFVSKSNTDKLAVYTKALHDRVVHAGAINAKLKAELDSVAASAPGSSYHTLLQATYEYAHDMAYTQLYGLYAALESFKNNMAGKKATDLAQLLKQQLNAVKAVEAKFDQKLKEIYSLLIAEGQEANAKAIQEIMTSVQNKSKEIASQVGTNQTAIITICKFRMS